MTQRKPNNPCDQYHLITVPTKTTQSVQDLKKAIAAELKNPEGWSSVSVAFADKELSDRESALDTDGVGTNETAQSVQASLHLRYKR